MWHQRCVYKKARQESGLRNKMKSISILKMNNFLIFVPISYLYLSAFDGVIKGISYTVGLPLLGQLKDAPLFLGFLYLILSSNLKIALKKTTGYILFFLALYILYSLYLGIRFPQIIFALKLLLPVIIGLRLHISSLNNGNWYFHIIFLVIITVIGLIANQFIDYPWQNIDIAIFGADISSSKISDVNITSLKRVPGFGATPGSSSIFILVLSIIFIYKRRIASKSFGLVDFLFHLTCIFGVIFTTQKTVLVALLACYITAFFTSNPKSTQRLMILLISSLIIPPIISFIYYINFGYTPIGLNLIKIPYGLDFLASYIDRIINIWPFYYSMAMSEHPILSFIFGMGIGSTGPSAKIFSPDFYHPGDGIIISLISYFGLIGFILILKLFIFNFKKYRVLLKEFPDAFVYITLIISLGGALNVIDSPLVMLFLGVFYSEASRKLQAKNN